MSKLRPRRSLKGLLIEPFKQIRFGVHVSIVSLIFSSALMVVTIRAFYKQYKQVIEWFQVAEITELMDNDVIISNIRSVLLVMILMIAVLHWVIFRRTHRMYGPMVAINRFLDDLKKGKFNQRVTIREKDDFKELVNKLNQLASTLEETFGSQAKLKETEKKTSQENTKSQNKKKGTS
jgi:nitrate/nitrite-specific signal transduction histidine kinase